MVATHQTVSTSWEHLAFGLGRHQWWSHLSRLSSPPNLCLPLFNSPGRFLAAIEMKAMLAHIVVTYDVKFEEGKGLPPERHMGPFRYPGDADVFFRKRQG